MSDLIAGEEWRHVHDLDRQHLKSLRPDAEVLAQARAGIERHRKADVRLHLVDAAGAPLRGLTVELAQERHAFVFGCAFGNLSSEESDPAKRERGRLFCELFNGTHAKCYWDEKWHQPIETRQGVRVTERFLAELDWGAANGLVVRGHPLVWTVPKAIPQWVRRYPYEQQLRFMEHNVRSLIQAAGGRIKLWDLVNEMLWEPSLRNLASRDWPHIETTEEMLTYIEPATRWAREEDPDARYVLNDYGLERTYTPLKGVNAPQQRQRFVELVEALRARGAAPDAIGTQGHVGKWFPMDLAWKTFEDLARAGVPLQISEFWAGTQDCPAPEGKTPQQIAAERVQYARDYYTVAFGHPAVEHLSWWGAEELFDRGGWVPSALYAGLHDLIRKEWWTHASLVSGSDGMIATRAFHGDYRLRWRDAAGNPHSRSIRIEPGRSCDGTITL